MAQSQDDNAANASRIAHENANLMIPGEPGHSTLIQLGLAHECQSDKETIFLNNVYNLGLTFETTMSTTLVQYPTGPAEHPILPLVTFSEEIMRKFPEQLMGGWALHDITMFEGELEQFWTRFKWTWPDHPVYQDHAGADLKRCIPCRIHCDEGTGVRRTGIMQISWGPIIKRAPGSAFHCFFYSCIHSDVYKDFNQGYKGGNKTLDDVMECFVAEALDAYWKGVQGPAECGKFFLVFLRQEGDLPAQAKIWHLERAFTNFPNPMCSWCMADGYEIDFADLRQNSLWRASSYKVKPWGTNSPMLNLPGGTSEIFLAKDLFHLSNLGITRTFVASLVCYLVTLGFFTDVDGGNSIPSRLNAAFRSFMDYCKLARETPDIKHFSRDGFKWKSPIKFPESSMCLGSILAMFWACFTQSFLCTFFFFLHGFLRNNLRKGSDTRLVLKWLLDFLSGPWLLNDVLTAAFAAATGMDAFHRLCFQSADRVWLNERQAITAAEQLGLFIVNYFVAAKLCFSHGQLFFNLTPKFHYLLHLHDDLALSPGQQFALNPAIWSTQMDEDHVGVTSRMSRSSHQATVGKRTGQRWLLHVFQIWSHYNETARTG